MPRTIAILAVLLSSVLWSVPRQFPVLGRGIPMATSGGGGGTDLTASDLVFKGYKKMPYPVDDNGNAVHYQFGTGSYGFYPASIYIDGSNVVHFFVATQGNQSWDGVTQTQTEAFGAPIEFTDNTVWDTAGNCSANCPNTTLASAPRIAASAVVAQWGINADGSFHDFWSTMVNQWWNLSTGALDGGLPPTPAGCWYQANGGQPFNDCQIDYFTVTPNGDVLASYQEEYGNPQPVSEDNGTLLSTGHSVGAILVHPTSANHGGAHSSTAYGPFIFKDGSGVVPPASGYGGSTGTAFRAFSTWSARWFAVNADKSMCWGSGDPGPTQFYGTQGPSLICKGTDATAWPTSATPASATARITSDYELLHYWNLQGYFNAVTDITGGALGAQPNWSFRFPGYQVAWEGDGTSSHQGVPTQINPWTNGGVTTWGDYDRVNGAVIINDGGKQGVIEFIDAQKNHHSPGTTGSVTCTGGASPSTNEPSHNYYCASCGVDCPDHTCNIGTSNTGPASSHVEAQWPIFKWADMQAVKSGSLTDYTVSPSGTYYPADSIGLPVPYVEGSNGFANGHSTVPMGYDPVHHILYVELPEQDDQGTGNHNPVIAYFYINR